MCASAASIFFCYPRWQQLIEEPVGPTAVLSYGSQAATSVLRGNFHREILDRVFFCIDSLEFQAVTRTRKIGI